MHTQISPTVPELCHMAARLVADETGVPLSEVLHACRLARPVSATRALAMYLAHVGLGVPMSAVGRAFGRHRSTVAHACRTVAPRDRPLGPQGVRARGADEPRAGAGPGRGGASCRVSADWERV
ncbi:chromosomal replication initiator DnaA [Ancylobacter sp. MQZ15Z-1]|uniref:Chromosomal replication initiator DnaA n=1 Tax=Ancylobacter mangrovi TaxID=2972472 RepID=A0A9X2P8Y0_9HYPH|nr:helix-turn-helix domain-containing protein [Ancylobacter mangrovi]MCS0494216.1 chromosomal replication initiator DnaA [Ancylobacter mangrovi]